MGIKWHLPFALAVAFAALGAGTLTLIASPAVVADGETFVVDILSDDPDSAVGDCVCSAVSVGCTLRAGIQEANACGGAQTIRFDEPPMEIIPSSALPPLTDAGTVIDGSDQWRTEGIPGVLLQGRRSPEQMPALSELRNTPQAHTIHPRPLAIPHRQKPLRPPRVQPGLRRDRPKEPEVTGQKMRELSVIHPKVRDERSEKIVFLAHCCLNQNAKVRGIARYPGAIQPLAELILERGVGMVQMPCPEMTYLGNMRWGQVKDQYDNPMFRRHCRRLAGEIVDQVDNYRQCGYHLLGVVMMDGSPVCGLNRTPRPGDSDTLWGGMTWYIPHSEYVPEEGVFCEVLRAELKQRGHDDIPFVAAPEFDQVGEIEEALNRIKAILEP